MRSLPYSVVLWLAPALSAGALAAEAQTSATAANARYLRNGSAAATARYEGDLGFARSATRSGPVSLARGVAVAFDGDGLSLSVSNALAPRFGPAVATTFNLSIGMDGDVSRSGGIALAAGPIYRSASAGGRVGTGRDAPPARAFATGRTDRFGRVHADTRAAQGWRRPVLLRPGASPEVVRYRTCR